MDAENVIVIVAQAILVHGLALKDAVMDALILVVVAPIAVQVVVELVVEDARRLAQLLVPNSVQALVRLDVLDIVIMDVQVKKLII